MANAIAIGCFLATIAGTLAVTVWASRRSASRADYYVAGSKITGLQNGFAIAGDFMSATTFLGLTGMYFASGADQVAIYFLTPLVGLSLMLLLIAGPLRQRGKFTLGDVMAARLHGPSLRLFSGASTVVISILYLVGQLVGAGTLISALFGLSFGAAVLLVAVLMTTYVTVGGMLAATWVQIIKACLLVAVVGLLAVLCVAKADGLTAIYAQAAAAHPLGWSLFTPGGSNTDLFSAVSLAFGLTAGMLGLPHILIRFFTVPDEREAQKSTVAAVGIIGLVFALMFAVLGPSAVAFLKGTPNYVTAAGDLVGGPNMASIHLSGALGGPPLLGVTSAVAFATILAVVAGLVMASATAASHDLYAVVARAREPNDRRELAAFRVAAAGIAAVSVLLAFVFQHENVAVLAALAFTVAASANVPVLLLCLYWPRLTTLGALSGGLFGLVSSVTLIALGPSVWVRILHHAAPLFPSDYPGLLVAPIAFVVAIVVSLARPEPAADAAPGDG
jgi:cation/acetate symporter